MKMKWTDQKSKVDIIVTGKDRIDCLFKFNLIVGIRAHWFGKGNVIEK